MLGVQVSLSRATPHPRQVADPLGMVLDLSSDSPSSTSGAQQRQVVKHTSVPCSGLNLGLARGLPTLSMHIHRVAWTLAGRDPPHKGVASREMAKKPCHSPWKLPRSQMNTARMNWTGYCSPTCLLLTRSWPSIRRVTPKAATYVRSSFSPTNKPITLPHRW